MGLQTIVYDCQVACIFFMTGGFFIYIKLNVRLFIVDEIVIHLLCAT